MVKGFLFLLVQQNNPFLFFRYIKEQSEGRLLEFFVQKYTYDRDPISLCQALQNPRNGSRRCGLYYYTK